MIVLLVINLTAVILTGANALYLSRKGHTVRAILYTVLCLVNIFCVTVNVNRIMVGV